ncbi:Cytochrome c biogenesis protein CcdA [Sulfobacillus thermosulfidooxidans DSM 9293]|uniref:Cytochrome c biogenesis protein CcdA n=1 Tax=Sulfobacillus thermosulfidooxidans (strain DSM 9293 / VKM B-1269 / AT-1) TaxID=929705 RepID=A0A1W1WHX9_SULTA|nr:cytochrome c biogenesis protein CcdA [Sulfobacillus thermosulfidooxidans]SMC05353.1 Cytochrome c biogenesis protein CcdA [Sulfobacillus thermosulfidooxidans DSM 9293]
MNLAFYMGIAAVFNPCGIALLPASFAWIGGTVGGTATVPTRVGRGIQSGILMAVGFTAVVAGLAVVVHGIGSALSPILHTVMLALSGLLIVGGSAVALGLFHFPVDRWTGMGRITPAGRSIWTLVVAGIVYGVAALSCTLPLFLAALAPAVAGGWPTVVQIVGSFGLGTAVVLVGVGLVTLFARDGLLRAIRAVGPWLNPALGLIIVGAGAYLGYYWLWGPGHFLA